MEKKELSREIGEKGQEEREGEQAEEGGVPIDPTEIRRRGRPLKAETWIRERSASDSSILESLRKRKARRDEDEEGEGRKAKKGTMPISRTPPRNENERCGERAEVTEQGKREIGEGEKGEPTWVKAIIENMYGGMKCMAEEIKKMREEMERGRTEAKEEADKVRKEIEELKRQGEEERRKLEERVEKLEEERKKEDVEEGERKKRERKEAEEKMKEMIKAAQEKENEGIREQRKRVRELEEVNERKEKQERKNNIIIRGEEIEGAKTAEQTARDIMEELTGMKVSTTEIAEIGRAKRAIMVKLVNWEDKKKVMSTKGKLKGRKIYIDDDLTKKERGIQNELWERAREEREKGTRTKVGYRKIWIGEQLWEWDEERGQIVENTQRSREGVRGRERGGRGGRGST